MTNKKLIFGKWIAVAVLAVAAGIFYCCGNTGPNRVSLTEENGGYTFRESMAVGDGKEDVAGENAGAEILSGETETLNTWPDSAKDAEGKAVEEPACYVYVCGEVLDPGVYRLSEGQRIYEAIGLAGGFTQEAAQSYLNLAQPVADGMKIEVPSLEQAAALPAETGKVPGLEAGSGKININTADRSQLMTLTGIGEARAEAIIAYRSEHGNFQCIEDIMNVSGIKEAAFQKIKEKITV